MPGTLVEYARFVEVQQRRARVTAELERPPERPVPRTEPTAVDQCIDVDESPTPPDASTTRGDVDVPNRCEEIGPTEGPSPPRGRTASAG